MKRVLIVDCAVNPLYTPKEHIRPFFAHVAHDFVSPEFEDLPENLSGYSHLVYSGSMCETYDEGEWQAKLYRFMEKMAEFDIPTLGICYGHQIIARTLLGDQTLRKKMSGDHGWEKVTVLRDDVLLGPQGTVWYPLVTHGYEVCNLSQNKAQIIASSKNCDTIAFKIIGKRIWGIQAHFEVSGNQAREFLGNFNLAITPRSFGYDYSDKTYAQHGSIFNRFIAQE